MNVDYRVPEITAAQAAELARADALVVPGRVCGTCSMCCNVIGIDELAKPGGEWCTHCLPGKGCAIYATRPVVCRGFHCEWMISKGLGPEWKPEKAKFVLVKSNAGRRLTAYVHPAHPFAWRRLPYYANFKVWAVQAAQQTPQMHMVDVKIGEHLIVILPDREVEVGLMAADELLLLGKRITAAGEVIEVHKIKAETARAERPVSI